MITLDKLKDFGADTDEGLSRCFGNEEFYLKLMDSVVNEKNFGLLHEALDAGDLDTGFECAHALKGVLANLALTPIAEPASEITELLRARTEMDYSELLAKLDEKKAEFDKLFD